MVYYMYRGLISGGEEEFLLTKHDLLLRKHARTQHALYCTYNIIDIRDRASNFDE